MATNADGFKAAVLANPGVIGSRADATSSSRNEMAWNWL
jgi:hypothetical protein